jgi:alginate O-acetyltransferase complex protein AlgI
MLFNSVEFAIFFPVVVTLYFALPHRFRWMMLLGASYYFYMSWKAEYLILIVVSTLIDYWAAIQMAKQKEKQKRRKFLVASLCSNLGILFFFKYFNFFSDSTRAVLESFSMSYDMPYFDLLLPVGISFYTFQTLSYSIDVFNGNREPERHLGIFALYVSFFPQLVAGPIERSTNLIPQFHRENKFDYQKMASGLKLMMWGLFKKLVVADRLGLYVDKIYADPESYGGITLIMATILFSFQIYCDFSGYSDIAIGTARTMGYDFMLNFRRPYFAKSIKEFWGRWHISLSTWFRDYLYIPLGGNRVSVPRWYLNLFIVFLVSGLWHGANWTFVVWGALHGIYLVSAIVFQPITQRLHQSIQPKWFWNVWNLGSTYVLVLIAWVFFRADNVMDAFMIVGEMFQFSGSLFFKGDFQIHLVYSFFAVAVLMLVEFKQEYLKEQFNWDQHRFPLVRELVYAGLAVLILLLGVFDGGQFIYFQF